MNAQTKTTEKTATTDIPDAQSRGALAVQQGAPVFTDRPIVVAIARVMHAVGAVEKDGYNEFHRYKYASAAAIAHSLQKLMAENGLVIVQRERDTRYDADMGMLAIRYDFDVQHTSGDHLEPVQHTGMSAAKNSKGGFDDKAANKCHTAARKYFLLGLFQIPTGDYPDADAAEDQPKQESNGQQPAKAPQEPSRQNGKSAPRPFALITGDGEELTFENGTDYLTNMEKEFTASIDKCGFWDSNQKTFESWQAKLNKVANNPKAMAEFARVGKEISETVFLLKVPQGA